jgi:HSP20 family protein
MKDLAPSPRARTLPEAFAPLDFIRREMDRLFDQASHNGGLSAWPRGGAMPDIDVAETDKEIQVTAELPGVDVKDVDVTLANGMLSIKGEKRSERDERNAEFHVIERNFGAFERRIGVPEGCDPAQVKAEFTNGVLRVTIPKPASAQAAAQKIEITKN